VEERKMMIIPEIETVVILVPRTGSGSLYRAIQAKYPRSMMIYRHMEADGVPHGYDRWQRIGVVRNPVDRLWSLYKFLKNFGGRHDPAYIAAMRDSVTTSFDDWILNNRIVFTSPYDSANRGRFFPEYTVNHPLPENRKSQFLYLRPDLGTVIYRYDQVDVMSERLGIALGRHNVTENEAPPKLSEECKAYMESAFSWEFAASKKPV
jgi:hypothetical protein